MDFAGKTALVTGAASGMGLSLSKSFAELGGNVVLVDINGEKVSKYADDINKKSQGKAIGVKCDVSNYNDVENACEAANEKFGSIDLLVNFAGGAELRALNIKEKEFPDIPIDVYDWSIGINLKGQLYFDHAVLKYMREQKSGVIINIGSITGEEGSPDNIGYATSKSGVMNGLTKSIAIYGARYGIRCCCISPGPVLTRPQMANMKTILNRAAEPQEIVDLILYVASDKGSFIDGTNILIDGGRNIMRNKG